LATHLSSSAVAQTWRRSTPEKSAIVCTPALLITMESSGWRQGSSEVRSVTLHAVSTPRGVGDLTELALAAGKGDRVALERFVVATQRDVWRFVAHLAGVGVADDLAQETYLRALPSLPYFAGRSSARTWLMSIARRVVVDHIRNVTSRPRTTGSVDWTDAADRRQAAVHGAAAGFEDLVEVNLLLDGLAPERREALVLTQVLGIPYAEAAEICEVPVGTIRSRVARAREDLLDADQTRQHRTG
jgi:RNA polymerase sigma-70 factor, ECF subfamily